MKRFVLLLTFVGITLAGSVSAHAGVAIGVCVYPDSMPLNPPLTSEVSITPLVATELYICAWSRGDSLKLVGWEGALDGPSVHDPTLVQKAIQFFPNSAVNFGTDQDFRIRLGTCVVAPPESIVVLAKVTLMAKEEFQASAYTLRGVAGQCRVKASLCTGESTDATSAFSAIYKNVNIYGTSKYECPKPILPGHPPFPNRVQPVVAAIGVVTDFQTPLEAACWPYSIVTVRIERRIVGDPSSTFSFVSLGAIRQGQDGRPFMVKGSPASRYQYFKVGDRIIFVALNMTEERKRIAYDPFDGAFRIAWAELLLQPTEDDSQPTYRQTHVEPTFPSPGDAVVNGKYNTYFIERTPARNRNIFI